MRLYRHGRLAQLQLFHLIAFLEHTFYLIFVDRFLIVTFVISTRLYGGEILAEGRYRCRVVHTFRHNAIIVVRCHILLGVK